MNSKREESSLRYDDSNQVGVANASDDQLEDEQEKPEVPSIQQSMTKKVKKASAHEVPSVNQVKLTASLSNLHEKELQKQLNNMTPIVSSIILANLLRLSEDDVRLILSLIYIFSFVNM